jgi:tetratricopeptide (TPR) repeat protein
MALGTLSHEEVPAKPPSLSAPEQIVGELLARIAAKDPEGIAAALDRLGDLEGGAAKARVSAAVADKGLTEAMLEVMERYARSDDSAVAWQRLAVAAGTLSRDELSGRAAAAALDRDPQSVPAAFLASVLAIRRGQPEEALRRIDDIGERVPASRGDPHLLLARAEAQLGTQQAAGALATLEASQPRLEAAGLAFGGQVVRARALAELPDRDADAVPAWQRAIVLARSSNEADHARDQLIALLCKLRRFEEAVKAIEQTLAETANPELRSKLMTVRPGLLAAKGDLDAAIAAWDGLLEGTTDPARRLDLRLRQARATLAASRWREAARRFDLALGELPAQDEPQRSAVRLEKAESLAKHDIDAVLADLDVADQTWTAPGWPPPIDIRMDGLLTAGRAAEAAAWLARRLEASPELAVHPASFQIRAEVASKLGDHADALAWLARAAETTPPDEARALAAVMAGAYGTQRWETVLTIFRRLGELAPQTAQNPNLRLMVATAHFFTGASEVALSLVPDAPVLAPSFIGLADQLRAQVLLRLGRLDDTLAAVAKGLERQRDLPVPAITALLYTIRAQVLNTRGDFTGARDAASAAIESAQAVGDGAFPSAIDIARIGARMQRSLAHFKLDDRGAAHRDADAAIGDWERIANRPDLAILQRAPDGPNFESWLWYAKGAIFEVESRNEEALAAYTRAARSERLGNEAAVARGFALSRTGDFAQALVAFQVALERATSDEERGAAQTGLGRTLVRLGRFEEAIAALQAALDARLTRPDGDAGLFELLGIAYDALHRNDAAAAAFRRAWALKPEKQRTANLARGITAAELRRLRPEAALQFLDQLPQELATERALQLNRALALDALGRRREAIRCLVKASAAGLDRAREQLERLDAPAGLARWTHHWFGAQASRLRRLAGVLLALVAAGGLATPLLQWWLNQKLEVWSLLLPSLVALTLLVLPNLHSITMDAGSLKLSVSPLPAVGREVKEPPAPEGFPTPSAALTMEVPAREDFAVPALTTVTLGAVSRAS